ncbi:MAG TPA: DUF4340 domain-containing protein [Terriglobia bacterium]|nr:DUF4340 domain-containing protein [Terriglobia bacterium]
MNRTYLKTLGAIVIFAALFVTLTHWDQWHKKKAKSSTPASQLIAPLKTSEITSFTLTPQNGKPITCQRQGKHWVIVAPSNIAASQEKVRNFLQSLATTEVSEVVDPHPASVKDFGLDPAAETIDVASTGKPQKFTLLLGDMTPTGEGVYAQVAGNPQVVELPETAHSALVQTLFDLRDTHVVTLPADQLQKIQAEAGPNSYTLTKNPEGVWELDLPPAVRAGSYSIETMVDKLRTANMSAVVSEDKKNDAQDGFEKPALRLTLTGSGGTQIVVLGKKDGDVYDAMNSGLDPVFTVTQDFLTLFQKSPDELREKKLWSWETYDVKHVDIQTPKDRYVFDKQNGQWKETSPQSKAVDAGKMETFLSDLNDLRAESFPKAKPGDFTPFGLDKAGYSIKVTFGDKNQTETVNLAQANGSLYARRSDDVLPSEISQKTLDSIVKSLGNL